MAHSVGTIVFIIFCSVVLHRNVTIVFECVPRSAFGAEGGHTHGEGLGGQYFGRHCSVLYIRKYFVDHTIPRVPGFFSRRPNWPRPLTRKRLSRQCHPPKLGTRGRHNRLRVRGSGGGEPIRTTKEKA
jgi:hypothetical protein